MYVIDVLLLAPFVVIIAYAASRAASKAWYKSKYQAMREMLKNLERD